MVVGQLALGVAKAEIVYLARFGFGECNGWLELALLLRDLFGGVSQ